MTLSLEYIAGFADADGSIGISKNKYGTSKKTKRPTYWARITMYSQNLGVLQAINDTFGNTGRLYDARLPEGAIGPGCYRVEWIAIKAVDVIRQIEPYMIVKKEQAKLAIQLHDIKKGSRWHGVDEEAYLMREYLFNQIKVLNHEDSERYRKSRVNSVEAPGEGVTPSRASEGTGPEEGVTHTDVTPKNNRPQERPSGKAPVRHMLSSAESQGIQ